MGGKCRGILVTNKMLRVFGCIEWYSQVIIISKSDLMPNISIIEKVNQQVAAIDYLVSKYTLLLVNQFVERQNFLVDKDISRMRLLGDGKE